MYTASKYLFSHTEFLSRERVGEFYFWLVKLNYQWKLGRYRRSVKVGTKLRFRFVAIIRLGVEFMVTKENIKY
jgi:hypothetical protein